jgi:hypothetical protein
MPFAVAKPTSYTLNSGHAKAPTHLWMLDEASSTVAYDKGTGTARNMTLQNAAQWGTDALGATMTVSLASSYYAISSTGAVWNGTGGLLLVGIFKTDAASGPDTTEFWVSTHNSTANVAEASIRNTAVLGSGRANCAATADDASVVSVVNGTDMYDQAWHMVAAKFQTGTGTDRCANSIDGGAWAVDPSDTLGAAITLTRYALGVRARLSVNGAANGQILAAWAYEGGTYADWDNAWIANLYADPFQFLNTQTYQAFQFQEWDDPLVRL